VDRAARTTLTLTYTATSWLPKALHTRGDRTVPDSKPLEMDIPGMAFNSLGKAFVFTSSVALISDTQRLLNWVADISVSNPFQGWGNGPAAYQSAN
jgi:hypothetical protein